MKSLKTTLPILLILISGVAFSQADSSKTATTNDEFPLGSVWINSEYPISLATLTNKVVVVVVTDENCVECSYFIEALQNDLLLTAQVQMLEVMQAGSDGPISRNHLVQYIQKNKINHPVGVLPDFNGFHASPVTQYPYFLLYEKNTIPSTVGGGHQGFEILKNRLNAIRAEKTMLASCNNVQIRPIIDPNWYANPVVECPTYIANQDGAKGLFINDAAHHRIMGFDENGSALLMIGSSIPGYSDGTIYSGQLNHPHGMVYHNEKLYIADTYNNRVRVADLRTEQLTTILGNGYQTWKKEETIDSKFQPLGLPVAVAFIGSKLYVASASTNQIFEVDTKDGQAKLLINLPESENSLLRSAPAHMRSMGEELLVTMNNGELYLIDKKAKITRIGNDSNPAVAGACEWEGGIAVIGHDGSLWFVQNEKWKRVGGQSKDKKNLIQFNHPTDMMTRDGDLYVTDTENHFVRTIGSSEDKMMMNYWMKMNRELIGFEPAHSGGELIAMDTVILNQEDITVNVLLDLHGYKLVENGQNEALMNELTGNVTLKSEAITKEEFSLNIKHNFPDPEIYVELYLTLEHPESPGLYIIKRAYLDFPVVREGKSQKVQEQVYTPILLPY